MIDWVQTRQQFGFASTNDLVGHKRPKVVCICNNCGKARIITVRVKSRIVNEQMYWCCPSCVNLRPDNNKRLVDQSLERWADDAYRTERQESSLEMWRNNNFRLRHNEALHTAMADDAIRERISAANRKRFSDETERLKIAEISRSLWADSNFRARHAAAMQQPKTRQKISDSLRTRWNDPAYRSRALAALNEIITRPATIKKLAAATTAQWADDAYRRRITEILNSPEVSKKISDASIDHWQNPEYRARVIEATRAALATPEVKQKLSDAGRRRWQHPEYRQLIAKAVSAQLTKPSSIELMLYTLLDNLGIVYHRAGDETTIGYYTFDCLVPKQGNLNHNILIECQGDYWHSLPKAKARDRSKFTYIADYFKNYRILYFWEREFYQHDRVRNKLLNALGLQQSIKNFDFKAVVVKSLGSSKDFLDLYHYLGPGRGGKRTLGAYLGEELIAVAIFSTPLRQNTAGQFSLTSDQVLECSRFCIHPSYQKKNFASWFLGRCAKQFSNILLYSYADSTVGHDGTIYKAAGWKLHHTVAPDYWYVDNENYVMHKRTLYGRARRMSMTEANFATQHGYRKIFGGPKLCFIKQT
jgi:hypothetical protein